MSYSRYDWSKDFVKALGNNAAKPEVEEFVVGWTYVETSAGSGAAYNLLNTTEKAHGSTDFNSAGVQNFTSYSQGIDVNASLVRNSRYYEHLYAALKNNDLHALGYNDGIIAPDVAADLQIWVSGKPNGDPQYPIEIRQASNKGTGDMFPGSKYTREQLVSLSKKATSDLKTEVAEILDLVGQVNDFIAQLD